MWWAWNYTTWVTNELDPDSVVVRLLLIGIMLGSLLMAVAIPQAFGAHGLLFAASYVGIQVGRHTFLTFASASAGTIERERADPRLVRGRRHALACRLRGRARRAPHWSPRSRSTTLHLATYWVRTRTAVALCMGRGDPHFVERFQLFVIIALGETIVITGATTAELELDLARVTAFGLGFLGGRALVALLRLRRDDRGAARAHRPGPSSRDAYTYLHAGIVAGIVLTAVGDELVIAHPTEQLPHDELAVVVCGPALYLLAHVVMRLRMAGTISRKRLTGALACLAVAAVGLFAPALVVGALLVAVLVGVIVAERIAEARREPAVRRRRSSGSRRRRAS